MDKVGAFLMGVIKGTLWGITTIACVIWLCWLIDPTEAAELERGVEYDFTRRPNIELDRATEIRLRTLIRMHYDATGCRACRIEEWQNTTQEERDTKRSNRIERLYEEYFHDE